jgi:hypothetical protein
MNSTSAVHATFPAKAGGRLVAPRLVENARRVLSETTPNHCWSPPTRAFNDGLGGEVRPTGRASTLDLNIHPRISLGSRCLLFMSEQPLQKESNMNQMIGLAWQGSSVPIRMERDAVGARAGAGPILLRASRFGRDNGSPSRAELVRPKWSSRTARCERRICAMHAAT